MKQQQDESLVLAERIRAVLPEGHASEKRMFGGITFLVNGNMLCCAFKRGLMLRVGTDAEAGALSQPFVRPLSKTRKMSGFVFVEPGGMSRRTALSRWIDMARAHVDPMPAKAAKAKRSTAPATPLAKRKRSDGRPRPARA
ncbi:TfoX/Sxy family protein [Bradyrhizobium diazoefficiens]|nr:TfoX/Sxy family protein [Bradyrhizobium diazoefficiens]MBR0701969.1 TfoX/Sxy family protein [Bradyrhizobium diazoefficiens]MBR0770392.1 TfoX/Sxy family protein [Bradyrhizobium diazoefficiens]